MFDKLLPVVKDSLGRRDSLTQLSGKYGPVFVRASEVAVVEAIDDNNASIRLRDGGLLGVMMSSRDANIALFPPTAV